MVEIAEVRGRWPPHGWLGLVLVGVFWALNWSLPGMRTHWGFFPLWLGYILTVDGIVLRRTGTSLLVRSRRAFAGLFLVSVPVWWLFEAINERTGNWIYSGRDSFTPLEYALLASWSFSTVIPAVFETAELCGSFQWLRRLRPGPRLPSTKAARVTMAALGALMLVLLFLWPGHFFPFAWLSIWFLVEPVSAALGRRSLLEDAGRGDWRPFVSLALGALLCGFFWEMWNYWSFPKWSYEVPFVGFGKVFEMPILGYGGYLPFAWELFALYQLVAGGLVRRDYLRLVAEDPIRSTGFTAR